MQESLEVKNGGLIYVLVESSKPRGHKEVMMIEPTSAAIYTYLQLDPASVRNSPSSVSHIIILHSKQQYS